jgi:hypothetical protein
MTQNAVANIMSQVNLQEQEPTSMWGKFKNFAGSDGGRMLLGGLGTALAVGLSGGDTKKALAYGLQGAGNVANNIYQREERAKKRYDDAMQTALQWQNQVANRELQKTLQTDRIKAQQDLAQTNYDNALDLLTQKATVEEQSKKRQREAEDAYYNDLYVKAGLTPEQITYANLQRKGINPSDMTSQMAYNTLYNPNATPEQKELAREQLVNIANVNKEIKDISKPSLTLDDVIGFGKDAGLSVTPESLNTAIESGNYNDLVFEQKQKGLTGDAALIKFLMDNGKSFEESLAIVGRLTPEQKNQAEISLAQGKSNIKVGEHQQISDIDTNAYGTKAGIDFEYQQQGADAELNRNKDFEGYKFDLGEKKADNALTREKVMADYNAKIAQAEAEQEAMLKEIAAQEEYKRNIKIAEFKASLPSERQREVTEMSIASGIPEKDIYQQMYNKMEKEGKPQAPTFGQLSSAVQNGVISPETANAQYGADVFQKSTKKQSQEEKAKLQREQQIASVQAVDQQLDEFEALFDSLPQNKLSAYTGGFFRDVTGTLTPEEVEFNAKRTLLFNKIARDLGGEKGVLSDQDIKRIERALPTMYDNPQQRASKLAAIRGLVEIRLNQLNNGMPTEEVKATNPTLNVGDVVDGYRYIGGEPSLETSWEAE